MKINNIILSADLIKNNQSIDYIQFWPLVSKIWYKLGFNPVLTLITDLEENDSKILECKRFGKVILIKPCPHFDFGIQAKVSRLFSASKLSGCNLIADIDLIPLNISYYLSILSSIPDNCIASFGANAFYKTIDHYKTPMCYITTSKETYQFITKISDNSTFEQFLNYYKNPKEIIGSHPNWLFDNKESTLNDYNNFSDESLLRFMIFNSSFDSFQVKIHRPLFNYNSIPIQNGTKLFVCTYADRIDRCQTEFGWKLITRSKKKYIKDYTDVHGVRPFQKYILEYSHIFKDLNIDSLSTIPISLRFGNFITFDHYKSFSTKIIKYKYSLATLRIEKYDILFLYNNLIDTLLAFNQNKKDLNFKVILSNDEDDDLLIKLHKLGAQQIFIINSNSSLDFVYSLPIGLLSLNFNNNINFLRSNQYNYYINLKSLKERRMTEIIGVPEIYILKKENLSKIFKNIPNYSFCFISSDFTPHSVFECIALGTIPIVNDDFISKKSVEKLPILFVKNDIESLEIDKLINCFNYYSNKPELFNTNPKITINYWSNKIKTNVL